MSNYSSIKLGQLVDKNRPITYGIVQPGPNVSPDGIPLIRGKDYSGGKVQTEELYHVLPEVDRPYSRSKVKQGDILLSIVGYVGLVAVVPKEMDGANITQTTARLSIDKSTACPEFVFHCLNSSSFKKEIKRYEKGSAQPGLNLADVPKFLLPFVDDQKVQKKIARILDTYDVAIEQTKELIQKYSLVKAGLTHNLLTRGLAPDGKLRPPREEAPDLYKETPIGWIPKEWGAKSLKAILLENGCYLQTGPFGSQLHAHEYTTEGIPLVMPQDINGGKIDETKIARISAIRARTLEKHRLKAGDIIIARRGELSRAASVGRKDIGSVCGTGCFLLRLGASKLDADFLCKIYRSDMIQRQVTGLAVGTTMPSLNNEIMGKLIFPNVKFDEQIKIANLVQLTESNMEDLERQLNKLLLQKSGLMHDLLTGKVQVKIKDLEAAHV